MTNKEKRLQEQVEKADDAIEYLQKERDWLVEENRKLSETAMQLARVIARTQ